MVNIMKFCKQLFNNIKFWVQNLGTSNNFDLQRQVPPCGYLLSKSCHSLMVWYQAFAVLRWRYHFLTILNFVNKAYITVPRPRVSPAVAVCGWWELTPDLNPTHVGVMVLSGPQIYVKKHILLMQTILQVDFIWLWPFFGTFDLINMCRFLHYINNQV